ncbi:DUF7402 domain-containing protein [Modestobacter sp. VKM Ac-2978]|uniref:DUF7402 domain-containing protein n=1 Tax=Modestobacter sp. VKM Ac-2978 TaxID=3004132 RepID=UPI0022AB2597|nr:discoidin domain-containing protein [Modestobacter sp. VKM Ac-2978]MCZ2846980.1 PIG-L family deacetylase [Modestobacter sp. VKM Ac-2978]
MRRAAARALVTGLVALVATATATATGFLASPAQAAGCSASSVNLVAHPDDDLFFMNPAVLQGIASGDCSTTVYVTSGDAGGEDTYYQGREVGVRAAYARMAGVADAWTTDRVTVAGKSVTRTTLTARPSVQLYFFRLPDGYADGAGSERSSYKSLEQLELGVAGSLETLDRPVQRYTRSELVATLAGVIASASPTTIRTLDEQGEYGDGDHSDHHAVGRLVEEASAAGAPGVPFAGYLGYTSTALPANVSGDDLAAKQQAYFAYAPYDAGMCQTAEECAYGSSGDWLVRQYTNVDLPVEPSVPTGENLAGQATVTASSENVWDGQTAVKAVDGVVDGYPGDHTAEWSSAGERAGAWLQLDWVGPVELNGVVLYDRPNQSDQVTAATLTFSDGSTVTVPTLDVAGAATPVTFPARSTTSVRITVTAVSGTTRNVGLAELQAWGAIPEPEAPVVPAGSNVAGQATVTASSENVWDGQTAVKAVDGVVDGYPGDHTAEWSSAGERAGAWLQLEWAGPVELNAVVLHDRPNDYDQVTGATLTFSDGSTVSVPSLANDGAATTVTFPARSTSSVRMTVDSVSDWTGNVGLAELETWGTEPVVTTPEPVVTTEPESTPSGTPEVPVAPQPSAAPTGPTATAPTEPMTTAPTMTSREPRMADPTAEPTPVVSGGRSAESVDASTD